MERRWVLRLASIAVATGLLLALAAVALADDADIVISEIMINAMSSTETYGEWIEIYNKGSTSVNITGWQIQDNNATDTITADMCPSGSCEIPAGACWIIGRDQANLQSEFDQYTDFNGGSSAVDTNRTIFLNNPIGNGLNNTADRLILRNNSGTPVDCYSWDGSGTCSGLNYVPGGGGLDGTLEGANGQSVTRIGTDWYNHRPNASPYNCTNTAQGGSPTTVTLHTFAAHVSSPALPWLWAATALVAYTLSLGGLLWLRRRQRRYFVAPRCQVR